MLVSPLAFSYCSDFNRQLAILEFNRPHDATGTSPGYGTFTPSATVPGLFAGGTQDNGVVYSRDTGSDSAPWLRHIGGDGGAAVFLAAKSVDQQPLATGKALIAYKIFVDEKRDPGAAGSGLWNGQQITSSLTIPLTSVDPAQTPPPVPAEGLKVPRVSAVEPFRNPMTGVSCCARVPIGHTAAAAPPRTVMNSRRCMFPPEKRLCAIPKD